MFSRIMAAEFIGLIDLIPISENSGMLFLSFTLATSMLLEKPNLLFAIWHASRLTLSLSVVATIYLACLMPAFSSTFRSLPSPWIDFIPSSMTNRQLSSSVSTITTFSPRLSNLWASSLPTPPPPMINISIGITPNFLARVPANMPGSRTEKITVRNTSPTSTSTPSAVPFNPLIRMAK